MKTRKKNVTSEPAVTNTAKPTKASFPAATRLMLRELRMRQSELEIQNEELRQAQAELVASLARYFDLYDRAPVGYVTVSAPGLILEANLTAATLLGAVRDTLVNQPFSRFILEEDAGSYHRFHRQLFKTGEPQVCELRLVKGKDTAFWVQLAATAAQDAEDTRVCRIALSDISAHKQAEGALSESDAKFRLLAESIRDVFWISTPNVDRTLYVRPAYEAIWGRTCASLYQHPQSFADAVHPEDKDRFFAALQEHVHGRWAVEYRIVRPDGSVRWILDRGFPVRDGRGELVQMCGVAKDITERKRTEDSLRELSAQLSSAEENERGRIARELHDSTGQKLAALAMTVGLIQDAVSAPGGKMSQMFADCLTLIEQCVQEIRTLAYLLHPPLLDDLGLAVAISAYAEEFSKRSGMQVALDLPYGAERLSAEVELALFRIVQESLGNIHRHAGTSAARIRLACDAEQAVLEVSDKGCGLAADKLRAIAAGYRSAGIGIVGIRERLRLVGGRLEIESDGQGTTVRAVVPIAEPGDS